jgi:hypothetical protein
MSRFCNERPEKAIALWQKMFAIGGSSGDSGVYPQPFSRSSGILPVQQYVEKSASRFSVFACSNALRDSSHGFLTAIVQLNWVISIASF